MTRMPTDTPPIRVSEEAQAQETGPAPIAHGHATRSKDVKEEHPVGAPADTHAAGHAKKAASAAPAKLKEVKEEEEADAPAHATHGKFAAAAAAADVKKEEAAEPAAHPPAHKKAKEETEAAGGGAAAAPHHALAIDRPLHAALETSPTPGSKKAPAILEQGRIVFLFDPTKAAAATGVSSLADVRHFFIALVPSVDSDDKAKAAGVDDWHARARLLIVGRKRLPSAVGERYWGFVDAVADTYDGLFKEKQAAAEEGGGAAGDDTPVPSSPKKGGTKRKAPPGEGAPAAAAGALRVVAEGDYAITRLGHAPGTGHMQWVLSEPHAHAEAGSARAEFGIEDAARFVCTCKNPRAAGARAMGLSVKAAYSPGAQAAFAGSTARTAGTGLAWQNATAHPELLSTVHAEFLLIRAKPAKERDPALTHSLAEAAAEDHAERVDAMHAEAKGAGGPAAEEFEATLAALNEELHARALGLDVKPAVTGQLE